ncbi:MAG: Diguanylate cyclase, domain, partial [Myxococcaceae bacterium]|nr:Diguanylate cyclase, domain [Myxococcaceae bacterium]
FAYEGRPIAVTISVGVATYPSIQAATPKDLVGAADRALLQAKHEGRNRCVVAVPRVAPDDSVATKRFSILSNSE